MNATPLNFRTVPVPHSLSTGAGATPAGAAWLQRLPGLVARAQQRWGLHLAAPFGVGTAAWTAPGTQVDGTPIVLKVTFPHAEAQHEATALRLWHGLAAVELLAHDEQNWILLLRRAHPGSLLLNDDSPTQMRLQTGLAVLANLHHAAVTNTPLARLSAVSASWAHIAAERARRWHGLLGGIEGPIAAGIDLLRWFGTPGAMPARDVVLHGDLNPGNVLLDASPGAGRHWLAIDPKPMIGDPAYDVWPLITQVGAPFADHAPDPFAALHDRVHAAAAVLQVAPLRIAQWGLARTVESLLWQWDTFADSAGRIIPEQQRQLQVWHWLARG